MYCKSVFREPRWNHILEKEINVYQCCIRTIHMFANDQITGYLHIRNNWNPDWLSWGYSDAFSVPLDSLAARFHWDLLYYICKEKNRCSCTNSGWKKSNVLKLPVGDRPVDNPVKLSWQRLLLYEQPDHSKMLVAFCKKMIPFHLLFSSVRPHVNHNNKKCSHALDDADWNSYYSHGCELCPHILFTFVLRKQIWIWLHFQGSFFRIFVDTNYQ